LRSGRLRLARLFAAGLLALPGAALSALPPYVYLEARASAGVHLQVQVTRVRKVSRENTCRIEGRALAVWRGSVKTGDAVRFSLPCRFASTPVMPGPTLWFDPSGLKPGLILEGFFDSVDGGLSPARDQVFQVRAASTQPRCGTGDYACKDESAAP
jgi:hypothetical protein